MDIPRFMHSSASLALCVTITTEWCAATLLRCFWVRLSGSTCATCRFLLVFSSSISSLSMASSSVLGSRSFLGTPCITSPYLRFLILTPLNTRFQSILQRLCGSSFDSQWSLYSSFDSLLMPCILGVCSSSLKRSVIALLHFSIMSLACIDFSWSLVVSGAVAAVMVMVNFSRCCFLVLSFFVFAFFPSPFVTTWLQVRGVFVRTALISFRSLLRFATSFRRSWLSCIALGFSLCWCVSPCGLVVSLAVVGSARAMVIAFCREPSSLTLWAMLPPFT